MATPYLTTSEADVYFSQTAQREGWFDMPSDQKEIGLLHATRIINQLPLIGTKTLTAQENEFPRDPDTEVPQRVLDACCEIAYSLIVERIDLNDEIAELATQSSSFGMGRAAFDPSRRTPAALLNIPSEVAWSLLRPYLPRTDTLRIWRVS